MEFDLKNEHEAAVILGLSVRTLQAKRFRGDNDLPYVKIGKTVRYRSDALRSFVEQHEIRPTAKSNGRAGA